MKEKSITIGLPVVPFNQSKHSDVSQYLQYLQNLLIDIYKPEVEFQRFLCHINNKVITIINIIMNIANFLSHTCN